MARRKTCKVCKSKFEPSRPMQVVCGPLCGVQYARCAAKRRQKAAETKAKRETARRREKIKTRSEWLREAQAAFNSFVRVRDHGRPCISSGRLKGDRDLLTGSRTDAGHYRSVGAAANLRFNLWNCHAQSVKDNRDLSGNTVEYRKGLIDRIGIDRVEALENDSTPRKFDIGYLKRVKRIFNKRARLYKRIKGL